MSIDETSESERWLVAHTRARAEKQLVKWATREGIAMELPYYRTSHRYRGKTVDFTKPLFPGYVFFRATGFVASKVAQSRHVAQILVPPDPVEFERQLRDILAAVEAGLDVRPAADVVAGTRVSITDGPLRGMEGRVEKRDGPFDVILRLDFIGQAAAVRVPASEVERIDG